MRWSNNMVAAHGDASPASTSSAAQRPRSRRDEDAFLDPLLDRLLGETQLAQAPDRAAVKRSSDAGPRIGDPPRPGLRQACGASSDAARTQAIAKAVCAAVLGSGAMLVQ